MIKLPGILNQWIVDILVFCTVTLSFHFFFRYWSNNLEYYPIKNIITKIYSNLSTMAFEQAGFFILKLQEGDVVLYENKYSYSNGGYISISSGCSALKQMLQYVVVIVFARGGWKLKLWYIPMGIFVMHLTNLIRIISLSLIIMNYPSYYNFGHDHFFRLFFYVVIFLMWMVWVEKVSERKFKIPSLKGLTKGL